MIGEPDSQTVQHPRPQAGEISWRLTDERTPQRPANDDTDTRHHTVAVAAAGGAFMAF